MLLRNVGEQDQKRALTESPSTNRLSCSARRMTTSGGGDGGIVLLLFNDLWAIKELAYDA